MELQTETKQIVVKNVPVDLWQRLKIRAAVDNATLQATLARAIEKYLSSDAA